MLIAVYPRITGAGNHPAILCRLQLTVFCDQPHTRTRALRARLSAEGKDMKTSDYYQSTADAMGLVLYLYADGSIANSRKVNTEPIAIIEPHDHWRPASDHGLGDQLRKI
jgi:hypothetical protein